MSAPKALLAHETLPFNGRHILPAAEYAKAYEKGWRHSATANASLDNPANTGGPAGWAWEDGYLDYAVDRPKWHRATCTLDEHDQPGCFA